MNQTRKLVALLLTTVLLLAVLPVNGFAAYKVASLKLNQWYNIRDQYSSNMTIYKLKVTGTTVVSYSWKNSRSSGNYGYVYVYGDKACTKYIDFVDIAQANSGSGAFVLYTGTYYFQMYEYKESAKIKFATRKAATVNKANYTRSRAIALKAGKKAEIAQTKADNYVRWYKITLPKKKKITFYGLESYMFSLYNSKLDRVSCTTKGKNSVTDKAQAKGTYYLMVNSDSLPNLIKKGEYTAFYWK